MNRKKNNRYLKIVEWSDEDDCYVGTAPGLMIGGVHGKNEKEVFAELCQAVDEAIALFEKEGRPLPPATADKIYSGKLLVRIPAVLHKALAIKALQEGESVNKFIRHELERAI